MCCLGLFMSRRCPRASPKAATALGSRSRKGAERTYLIEDRVSSVRYAGSPSDRHRRRDQQHKEDGKQHRGDQPLTQVECGKFSHMTAIWLRRERNALSHR